MANDERNVEVDIEYALECATEEQLIDELKRRFVGFVLVYEETVLQPNRVRNNVRWNASYPHAIGLLEYAKERIQANEYSHVQDEGDE